MNKSHRLRVVRAGGMTMSVARYTARNAVFGFLVALPLIGALLFQWDVLRPLVEREASAALGRAVRIGHLDVALARQPVVVFERVAIANPDEFPADSTMATIDRLAARVDLD